MKLNRRTLLGGAAVLGGASDAFASTRGSGGGRGEQSALSDLARYVEQHRADWGLPGMTVCVVTSEGYTGYITSGYADAERRIAVNADHLFQIGSITKMMAALTAYSLIQDGKLAADAKLSTLMPELNVRDGGGISLQHILNHTSGLPGDAAMFNEMGLWAGYAPGSHWSYSNLGYAILGHIIARADGRSFEDAVTARVLTPLGMRNSKGAIKNVDRARHAIGYQPLLLDRPNPRPMAMAPAPWTDVDFAAGCVSSTAADMAIFMRFLMNLNAGHGAPVLSDETARRFMADPADAPGWAEGAKYGNGIARLTIEDRAYLHHTGGMVSFSSAMHIDPVAGVGVFASSNVAYQLGYRPRDVSLYGCQLMRAAREAIAAPTPRPTKPAIEHADKLAGHYTAQNGDSFELVAQGTSLKVRRDGRESEVQFVGGVIGGRDPAFEVMGLMPVVEGENVVRAWAGEVEYLRDATTGYTPPPSAELRAFSGRYCTDNPWEGSFRIHARDGRLWADTEALTRRADGDYQVGSEDWVPERLRFGGVINGKPTMAWFSGSAFQKRNA